MMSNTVEATYLPHRTNPSPVNTNPDNAMRKN